MREIKIDGNKLGKPKIGEFFLEGLKQKNPNFIKTTNIFNPIYN